MPYSLAPVTLQPEDDVDELFGQLDQLEPPGGLVARILTHIGRLPKSSVYTPSLQPGSTSGGEREGPVVRNEWREPS